MTDKTKIASLIAKAVDAHSSLEALQFSQAACNAANAAQVANNISDQPGMSDAQIRHMVDRFLAWRLPDQFGPDNGIRFTPSFDTEPMRSRHWPVGTNLFCAAQAEAMVRHITEGLPRL